MSKELRQRGFRFVGPTICYAFMQAVGMVNDHVVDLLPPPRAVSREPVFPHAGSLATAHRLTQTTRGPRLLPGPSRLDVPPPSFVPNRRR